jgi:peptidoglycan-N-acetylglucosamine deacetylase
VRGLDAALLASAAAILMSGCGADAAHTSASHPRAGARPTPVAARGPVARSAIYYQGSPSMRRLIALGRPIYCAPARGDEVALTFDDGPGPYTPRILSTLERQHVPATFFEVGVLERYFYASTARIVADGDVIGDHTEMHAPMSKLPAAQQKTQLLEQISAIERWGAKFPRLFRPPYGLWNATTLALLHRYRMLMVLWTVDTNDYRRPGVSAIVDTALDGARPGAIILLHDAGGDRSETAAALPRIIAGLRRRRYKLVTVPRLLLDNPPPRVQNIAAVLGTGG